MNMEKPPWRMKHQLDMKSQSSFGWKAYSYPLLSWSKEDLNLNNLLTYSHPVSSWKLPKKKILKQDVSIYILLFHGAYSLNPFCLI